MALWAWALHLVWASALIARRYQEHQNQEEHPFLAASVWDSAAQAKDSLDRCKVLAHKAWDWEHQVWEV